MLRVVNFRLAQTPSSGQFYVSTTMEYFSQPIVAEPVLIVLANCILEQPLCLCESAIFSKCATPLYGSATQFMRSQ
jgi:hypothetical protein